MYWDMKFLKREALWLEPRPGAGGALETLVLWEPFLVPAAVWFEISLPNSLWDW